MSAEIITFKARQRIRVGDVVLVEPHLLFGGLREIYHGPRCVCGSRNTAYIGTGRRYCKTCGLVEFGMTPTGYRGIRKVEAR